jgi:hypothetical protein
MLKIIEKFNIAGFTKGLLEKYNVLKYDETKGLPIELLEKIAKGNTQKKWFYIFGTV